MIAQAARVTGRVSLSRAEKPPDQKTHTERQSHDEYASFEVQSQDVDSVRNVGRRFLTSDPQD